MSTSEHLFFDPGASPLEDAARVVTRTIGATLIQRSDDEAAILPWPEGGATAVVSAFEDNDYTAFDPDPADPEDRSVFDDFPYLCRISLAFGDGESQRRAGRHIFDRLAVSELGWPLVLVHEFELLIATYDVERGVREFPPGTRSDGTDEHLWR